MLKSLFEQLALEYSVFNVFRYLSFRAICAVLTALLFSFIAGPALIRRLERIGARQPIRDDGPSTHLDKDTPTMGGVLILSAVILSALLWADLGNRFIWIVFFSKTRRLLILVVNESKNGSESMNVLRGWGLGC